MSEPRPVPPASEQTLPTQHGSAPPGGITEVQAPFDLLATLPPTEGGGSAKPIPGLLIERELGRGGMGVVYQARHVKLGRTVAVKLVLSGSHAGSEDLTRFLTEAQALAVLHHPNIVQVYEIGQHDGCPYFTLEFVPGGTLSTRLKGEPQPIHDAAHLVELLARAVDHAHKAGIIHRDLKPANVLLVEDAATPLGHCTPKITDFGLAKRTEVPSGMTQSGAVMGTPSYMAPEQAAGKTREVGPAADIHALGAILYETLTGRPPFVGQTTGETLLQVIVAEPPTLRQLRSGIPFDLQTICHKCLHKEPARRYATAAELAEDLRRFQAGEPIQARPVGRFERGWRWCRRNRAVAGLSASLVLVFLVLCVCGVLFLPRLLAPVAEQPTPPASPTVLPDPRTLIPFRDQPGRTLLIQVVGDNSWQIYGTDVYSDDSRLGTAAVHAGILKDQEEGVVKVTLLEGRDSYEGTMRHGVQSAPYGQWAGSYRLEKTDIAPQPALNVPLQRSVRIDERFIIRVPRFDLREYRDRVGQSFIFTVTGRLDGFVWGNDVYTDDSDLETAAVHAGVVKAGQKAKVKVTILPGQKSYPSAERNGVVSRMFEDWLGSFRVTKP